MVNHFANIPASGGQRQMIHPRHLLSEGADMKIVDRRRPSSPHGRGILFFVRPDILHAVNNVKCSRASGNHAIATGLTILETASRASEIMRATP